MVHGGANRKRWFQKDASKVFQRNGPSQEGLVILGETSGRVYIAYKKLTTVPDFRLLITPTINIVEKRGPVLVSCNRFYVQVRGTEMLWTRNQSLVRLCTCHGN
jgi:hypothetical protein